jgi:hypothetical protein
LVRLAIRPVILGKKIELISTADPYADLKPRDRGTIVNVSELPYEDSLSRFGFIGIVTQDLQFRKDTTATRGE